MFVQRSITALTRLQVRRRSSPRIPRLTLTQSIRRHMSTAAKSPLILYTEGTPNGKKVAVHLEELKSIYGDKVAYE